MPNHVDVLGVELPTPSVLAGVFTNYLRVYGRFGILAGSAWRCWRHSRSMLSRPPAPRPRARRRGARPARRGPRLRRPDPDLERQPSTRARHLSCPPTARHRRVLPAAGRERSREPLRQGGAVLADPARAAAVLHRERAQGPRLGDPELVDRLDTPNVPQLLAAEGVRYVVVNDAAYRSKGEEPPGVPPQPLLARFGDIRVFKIVAEPGDLETALHDQAAHVAAAMGIPVPSVQIVGSASTRRSPSTAATGAG